MTKMMVRYRVKAEHAAENEKYISHVFEQLQREKPMGLRYESFKLKDHVSFVHIFSQEPSDGQNPLAELSSFKAFASSVSARCDEPPVSVELNEIGSYGVFGK